MVYKPPSSGCLLEAHVSLWSFVHIYIIKPIFSLVNLSFSSGTHGPQPLSTGGLRERFSSPLSVSPYFCEGKYEQSLTQDNNLGIVPTSFYLWFLFITELCWFLSFRFLWIHYFYFHLGYCNNLCSTSSRSDRFSTWFFWNTNLISITPAVTLQELLWHFKS